MRRFVKISAWVLGALTLLLLLLAGAVLILGNTPAGRVQIEKLTARLTRGTVQLSGLAGSFPSHLTLEQLLLRIFPNAKLTWLTRALRENGQSVEIVAQLMAERGLEHAITPGYGWITGDVAEMAAPVTGAALATHWLVSTVPPPMRTLLGPHSTARFLAS